MKRDEAVHMRDKAGAEIAKMFAAVELSFHQPNHTIMRLTMFLQFHSAACAHLAALDNEFKAIAINSCLADAVGYLRDLVKEEEPAPLKVGLALDRVLQAQRIGGGA